jgi:hypothetical protein
VVLGHEITVEPAVCRARLKAYDENPDYTMTDLSRHLVSEGLAVFDYTELDVDDAEDTNHDKAIT